MKAVIRAPLGLITAYLLLLGAWALTNPPGAAPDEYGHYLRALAAGRGIFAPDERPPPLPPHEASQLALRWQRRQSRLVEAPGRLSPEAFNQCLPRVPMPAWDCPKEPPPPRQDFWLVSIVGTYPPYGYVLPGIFSRLGSNTTSALLWARAAAAAVSAVLMGAALWALWDPARAWVCLLGWIAAVTPMVIFVGSSLTPSALEAASAICFFACMLRLSRPQEEAPRWIWGAAGISGALLASSRDPGIFWMTAGLLLFVGFCGPKAAWARFQNAGKIGLVSLGLLFAGLVAAAMWQVKVQVHPAVSLSHIARDFASRLHITKEVGRQQIGVFGWLDTLLPSGAYVAWVVLLASLGALALFAGNWRERSLLAMSAAGVVAVPVVLDILQREVGFGVQGRHVLPFTVAAPLVAGEILTRNAQKLDWLKNLRPALWFASIAAAVNCLAWFVNARRYTAGPEGPFRFWQELNSAPPLSWTAWCWIVGAAGLLSLLFGIRASFSRSG